MPDTGDPAGANSAECALSFRLNGEWGWAALVRAVGVFSWIIHYPQAPDPIPAGRCARRRTCARTTLATIAVNMVAATLAWSRQPEVSAATATAAVIGVAISCTDQVARLSSMMRQCSLLQRDLPQFNPPRVNRGTGLSGPAALRATTRTPTTRRWTGAVRRDSPVRVAAWDGGAVLAVSLSIQPRQAGLFCLNLGNASSMAEQKLRMDQE